MIKEKFQETFLSYLKRCVSLAQFMDFPELIYNVKKHFELEEHLLNALIAEQKIYFEHLLMLGNLSQFFTHQDLQEITIHHANTIFITFKNHHFKFTTLSLTQKELELALELLALKHHHSWNKKKPFVSFQAFLKKRRLRLTLLHPTLNTKSHPLVALRFHAQNTFSLESFASLSAVKIIKNLIRERANILFSGETGSGKTSLLSTTTNLYPQEEHLVTLEDTAEINSQHEKTTSLLGSENASLTDLCAYSLRISPDRLILGEIRSREIIPFFLAMNTGHKGLLASIHANSALDTLHRATLLFKIHAHIDGISYEDAMALIVKNIHYVIYLEQKKISQIYHVFGQERGVPRGEIIYENFSLKDL